GEPKYLNSPETPLFSKGRELYGLFEGRTAMRERGYALVTEGYMDVVALAQMGFGNAVATLGTACTPEHIHKLFRFTHNIVFSFDGDAAGRRAARKALEAALPHATDTRTLKFLFLPSEHDPDSFIRANGAPAFEQAVASATPLSQFLIDVAAQDVDLNLPEGRAHFLTQAQALWQALPDGALKRQMLSSIADQAQLGGNEVLELWQGPSVNRSGKRWSAPTGKTSTTVGNGMGAQKPINAAANQGRAYGKQAWQTRAGASGRGSVTSRADHVARIVLTHPAAWGWLSTEDQHMLAELPPPHGPLFTWLESQWHDHGAQPWAALQVAIQSHAFSNHALRLVAQADTLGSENEAETRAELEQLLKRMLIEHLKREEGLAIEAGESERYKALQARRLALQSAASGG
ncbi:MAG: toprim domain-containing protein, partial [Burkholderiaceae bacterium]|nr:toprim domain-containing protein [Burkholderiaceae bacterium]